MNSPSEIIPKFIISLEKDKDRKKYLEIDVLPKLTNYNIVRAFDGENDDPNPFLINNNLYITEDFYRNNNIGQLGCFISHFKVWKHIVEKDIDVAIILEDDVKIYSNFNRIINIIYERMPFKCEYIHLFIHPDKLDNSNLESKDGEIIPAKENFGTVAYMITKKCAKKLIKLTQLIKIQAAVDRQINYYITSEWINAYMVQKPFIITQGEIMPGRYMYENGFKSNIWYSRKIYEIKKIKHSLIKKSSISENEINILNNELNKNNSLTKNIIIDNNLTDETDKFVLSVISRLADYFS